MAKVDLQPKARFIGTSYRFSDSNGTIIAVSFKENPTREDYALYNKLAAVGGAHYFENGDKFSQPMPQVATKRSFMPKAKKGVGLQNEPEPEPEPKKLTDQEKKEFDAQFLVPFMKLNRTDFGLDSIVSLKDLKRIALIVGVALETDRAKIWLAFELYKKSN